MVCAGSEYLKQGIADYEDESYEEALESLIKARGEDPASAEAAYYLGLTYGKLQDYKNAAAHLKEALVLDPELVDGHLFLAEALYNLNDLEGALKELDEAAKRGSKPGEVYFLRGLIELKAGKNKEAIVSFGKAREADEGITQAADYQTAIAYIRENRLKEARDVFGQVAVRDPSTDLAFYASEYSKALEKREEREKPLKLYLGLRYEYDDNVVLKPADSALAGGITDQVDRREAVSFRGDYTKRFSGPWSLRAQYSLYLSNQHHLKSHNVQSHTATLTPSYNFDRSTANLGLSYTNTLVHGREYLQSAAVSPGYNFMIGASNVGVLSMRFQKREFAQAPFSEFEDRDSTEFALGAGLFSFFSGDEGFVSLKYEVNREDADGGNWTYTGHKGSLSLLYPLGERLKLQGYAEAFSQDFKNTNTFFSTKRKDMIYSQSVLFSYEFYKKAEFVVQYTHVRDDSNIAIYDYNRNIISAGVEFRL
jgi:tetratricopeptide (TPR) repeat protein